MVLIRVRDAFLKTNGVFLQPQVGVGVSVQNNDQKASHKAKRAFVIHFSSSEFQ
jgi:hypothetical protein